MKIVKSAFNVLVSHIPHKIREHDVQVFSFPEPAVHIRIGKVVAEIIGADTYAVPLFIGECRIPYFQEILLKSAGFIGRIVRSWVLLTEEHLYSAYQEKPARA